MAIIFSTRFNNPLNTDFPESAPHGTNYKIVARRGIDIGNSLTCTNGPLTRTIATYGGANFQTITLRVQWSYIFLNNFLDDLEGISTRPGHTIFDWGDPLNANTSTSAAFSGQLKSRPNGMLTLYINGGGGFDSGRHIANSATGVLIYDGRMHGIQMSLQLTSYNTVIYNVVVNNTSVISGSFTVTANMSGFTGCSVSDGFWGWPQTLGGAVLCLERAAITQIGFRGFHTIDFNSRESSIPEVQIEDSINIIDYPPCNAINAVINPCVPPGMLTVTKISVPSSGSKQFDFTVGTISGGIMTPSTFNLAHGESQVLTNNATGAYSVVENPDPDWTPSYVSSTDTPNTVIPIWLGDDETLTVTNTPNVLIAGGGIYFINPTKATRHDSYYGDVEKKIPNPTIKTALIGE